jgi:polysaccharide export outer membrane protein
MKRGTALRHPLDVRMQGYRDEVSNLERKITELRAKGLADGHPDIQSLMAQIKELQRTVSEHQNAEIPQFDKRSNPAYDALLSRADQIRAHLKAARSELGIVEESLNLRRKVSNESPKVNARMDELQRQKDEAIRQHGILFDRLKKAEVQLQLERVSAISRYEIVVPARLEAAPGRKALALRLAIGLGLGILLTTLVLGIGELSKLIARVSQSSATTLLMICLAGLFSQGCAHDERFTWVEDLPAKDQAAEQVVHRRDTILVEVVKQPTLSGEFVVRDDGHYTQPMVGSIQVAGQTPREIANAIAIALKDIVVNPVVSVWITKPSPIRISVVGEVKTPGTYELSRDRSLSAVLAAAGWLTEFAHSDRVFVVRAGNQERIRFHVHDITTAEPHAAQFQMGDADVVVVE